MGGHTEVYICRVEGTSLRWVDPSTVQTDFGTHSADRVAGHKITSIAFFETE